MLVKLISILIFPLISLARLDCDRREYDRCIRIADPLVKKAHLIFPDTKDDIDLVCRTWNRFVDCLNAFTDNCFTEQQRKQFNRAVESPIESVHQMCTQPAYQDEYLRYAPCIKSTITENRHCGAQYNLLVDQVAQGEIISKSTLCCSHDRFKQCVVRKTKEICDRDFGDGPASRFSGQILDKALSFLQDQCLNYIPNSGDCTLTTDTLPHSDSIMISTSSSEVYPWSTIQDPAAKEILPSRVTPPKIGTTSTWLPSSNVPPRENSPTPDSSTAQMLGSRTRPASYGRASSWPSSSNPPSFGNTVQMYPESASTPSSRPDWATMSSWNVMGQSSSTSNPVSSSSPNDAYESYATSPVQSSTIWYPVAGSQVNNDVEEPNQLGLRKPKNHSETTKGAISLTVIATILIHFC